MATLEAMAAKGVDIYRAKLPTMKTAYAAAESRAKTAFGALPFGPTRTAAYERAWAWIVKELLAIAQSCLVTTAQRWFLRPRIAGKHNGSRMSWFI